MLIYVQEKYNNRRQVLALYTMVHVLDVSFEFSEIKKADARSTHVRVRSRSGRANELFLFSKLVKPDSINQHALAYIIQSSDAF